MMIMMMLGGADVLPLHLFIPGCQSLFCEELGIEDSQQGKETSEAEEVKDDEDGEKGQETSQGAPQEEEDTKKVIKADHGGFEQKNRKRTRTKKATEHLENIKEEKDVVEDNPEAVLMSSEANLALTEPPVGLITTRDLSEPVYLGCGGSDLDGPRAPLPMVQLSQNPGPVQLAPTKRSPGHSLPQTVSQQALEPLEVTSNRFTPSTLTQMEVIPQKAQSPILVPSSHFRISFCPFPGVLQRQPSPKIQQPKLVYLSNMQFGSHVDHE